MVSLHANSSHSCSFCVPTSLTPLCVWGATDFFEACVLLIDLVLELAQWAWHDLTWLSPVWLKMELGLSEKSVGGSETEGKSPKVL